MKDTSIIKNIYLTLMSLPWLLLQKVPTYLLCKFPGVARIIFSTITNTTSFHIYFSHFTNLSVHTIITKFKRMFHHKIPDNHFQFTHLWPQLGFPLIIFLELLVVIIFTKKRNITLPYFFYRFNYYGPSIDFMSE